MEVFVLRKLKKAVTPPHQTPSRRKAALASSKLARPGGLRFDPLEPRLVLDGNALVISEFMALNDSTLADENGAFSDWIEIHNPTDTPLSLDGWYLTDEDDETRHWRG